MAPVSTYFDIWALTIDNLLKFWIIALRLLKRDQVGFPGGAVVENLPADAGDTGSSPGLGRSHMLQSN